jgi:L-ascorbate metabolism protein UlaG (beta-lactamase superfamily)
VTTAPLRIEFLGHATVLIDVDGVRILTDPLLRPRISGLVHRQPYVLDPPPRNVDAVLISHLHHDHLDLRSLRILGRQTRVVVPSRGRGLLHTAGFANTLEVQPLQRFEIDALHVLTTRAVHIGLRAPFGPWGGTVGFVLEASRRVYFAGDTQEFAEMSSLGPIDVALMPIAGWGPVLGPGHMAPAAAVRALRLIRPRVAIPIHWGSLVPLGFHRRAWGYLTQPAFEFVEMMRAELPEVQVRVLLPGESFEL